MLSFTPFQNVVCSKCKMCKNRAVIDLGVVYVTETKELTKILNLSQDAIATDTLNACGVNLRFVTRKEVKRNQSKSRILFICNWHRTNS